MEFFDLRGHDTSTSSIADLIAARRFLSHSKARRLSFSMLLCANRMSFHPLQLFNWLNESFELGHFSLSMSTSYIELETLSALGRMAGLLEAPYSANSAGWHQLVSLAVPCLEY